MLKTQVAEQNKFFETKIYNSDYLMKFIKGVSIRNKNTAKQYYSRLTVFEKFVNKNYEINIDKLMQQLKNKEYDPYDILNDFCVFLQNNTDSGSKIRVYVSVIWNIFKILLRVILKDLYIIKIKKK